MHIMYIGLLVTVNNSKLVMCLFYSSYYHYKGIYPKALFKQLTQEVVLKASSDFRK